MSMNREDLDKILTDHKNWVKTTGEEGCRADLSGADLSSADLSSADLRNADLWDAYFTESKKEDILKGIGIRFEE